MWSGEQLPQPGDALQPLTPEEQQRLQDDLKWFGPRLAAEPTLLPMLEQLERLAAGLPAKAIKVWELPGPGGESLAQYNSRRKLGGRTAEGVGRCRKALGRAAKGRKVYAMAGGAAHNHQHKLLTQAEVGKPRPPSLRDSVRALSEMAESLTQRCVKLMGVGEVGLVKWADTRLSELLVTLLPQYKPGGWLHKDPRWRLNLLIPSWPVK